MDDCNVTENHVRDQTNAASASGPVNHEEPRTDDRRNFPQAVVRSVKDCEKPRWRLESNHRRTPGGVNATEMRSRETHGLRGWNHWADLRLGEEKWSAYVWVEGCRVACHYSQRARTV
jgi:hypothetical protein